MISFEEHTFNDFNGPDGYHIRYYNITKIPEQKEIYNGKTEGEDGFSNCEDLDYCYDTEEEMSVRNKDYDYKTRYKVYLETRVYELMKIFQHEIKYENKDNKNYLIVENKIGVDLIY